MTMPEFPHVVPRHSVDHDQDPAKTLYLTVDLDVENTPLFAAMADEFNLHVLAR